jgi:hypothetical protein
MSLDVPEWETVDLDVCASCSEVLTKLHNALMRLAAGGTRLKVRHDRRWTEYQPGSTQNLQRYIEMLGAGRGAPMFLRIG